MHMVHVNWFAMTGLQELRQQLKIRSSYAVYIMFAVSAASLLAQRHLGHT